jgi:hypothetical protein
VEGDAAGAQFRLDQFCIMNDVFDDEYIEFLLHAAGGAGTS